MDKPADPNLSEIEREAERAILVALTNLPAESAFANSRAVLAVAVRQLSGSTASPVPVSELRQRVSAAAVRLQADGFLDAPDDPKKCWRLTHGRDGR